MNKASLPFRIAKKTYHACRKVVHNVREQAKDLNNARLCRKLPPCLIMNCDGGICSQIHQYIWGQMLIDMGYPVKYDYTFYEDDGKDMYGNFDRSYVLDKLCNLDRLEVAPRFQVEYYKKHYLNPDNQPPKPIVMDLHHDWHPPLYMGLYYTCAPEEYVPALNRYIRLKAPEEFLDKPNLELYHQIRNSDSVGIHIRRGDMSQNSSAWTVPSVNYFFTALQLPEFAGKTFYFFSDEMPWVKENIISKLPDGFKYHLMDQNDSSKGYMDFYLLSCCKHQIASQGTFGSMSYVLNPNPDKILVLPKDGRKNMQQRLASDRVIFISLDGQRL